MKLVSGVSHGMNVYRVVSNRNKIFSIGISDKKEKTLSMAESKLKSSEPKR